VVERLADLPAGLLGFRISGRLSRDDYTDVLLPPVREAVERGDKVRMLVVMGPDFTGLEPGALWEDLKAAADLGIRHRSSWERVAIVTDAEWLRRAVELLGWLAPGQIRVFPLSDVDAAKAWLVG
jgi:hypothetical protein